ncbi:SDR family oxidoreductase [Saccharospirillum mangrovi]|uniref:SDR family oxidoreductase n=1 Tax=Saccharospirillum mangrovi TaxID=2161747 RepID=UPI000D37F964|nr:SDR family oxidoreductase [Saccharospirillum mangrovi]
MTERTWLITGINSGFGRLMTETLLARGERVAGTTRNLAAVNDLKAQYGERLWVAVLDLTDTDAIHTTVQRAYEELGRIDVVVNNAGYGLFGAAEGLSNEQIRHQLDTNLVGPIQVVRAALPFLRQQAGGHIIQLSTYGGQATHPGASLYHASKWGIEGFMESLAAEVSAFGIKVTLVEPGGARTAFRSAASSNLGLRLDAYKGTPADMVHTVLTDPAREPNGDPAKMAAAMINCVDIEPAPRRLILGSDAYRIIHDALSQRLAELEAQEETAAQTDISAG